MLLKSVILIFLISLTAAVAVWQLQLPPAPPTTASADVWELPGLPQGDKVQASHAKLRTLNPWKVNEEKPAAPAAASSSSPSSSAKVGEESKKPATPTAPPPPVSDWQLVGIVRQGDQRYILVLDKANKVTQYSVTSSLPNGTTLSSIHDDFIEVSKQGKTEVLRLYE